MCIGSHWPGPLNFPSSRDEFNMFVGGWRSKFKEAKDILLVGAGAVGLGKILNTFPPSHSPPFRTSWRAERRVPSEPISPRSHNLDLLIGSHPTDQEDYHRPQSHPRSQSNIPCQVPQNGRSPVQGQEHRAHLERRRRIFPGIRFW